MDPEELWYGIVRGDTLSSAECLEQGDIIRKFPITRVGEVSVADAGKPSVKAMVTKTDVIVLTQSCDIPKVAQKTILVAEVRSYDKLAAEISEAKSPKWRAKLSQGNIPGLFLLHTFSGSPEFPWSIASFRDLHVLAKSEVLLASSSAEERLRLKSPYKEHLSQGYARFMMRVGLPVGAPSFESYTPRQIA
ncbi:hypothetical protein [Amycolatopsis sp. Poz14]|uniref:hypothetical protein n=1 Tax=Amycolatopsis sp. Poz14 TaxID=1447705 RepID=UPI001EE98932|nr:hypothetical protein [Amycolatopsis sp. Poz14]MCG3749125.1 hypothetical protein [Amycolatopsis sp. Poz14]